MMQQQQQKEHEESTRKGSTPLSELVYRVRKEKYTPSREEYEALVKCKKELLLGFVKYPLIFGVFAGTVSYRLKFLTRVCNTTVASILGYEFGIRQAESACMKHVFELQGSPLQAELAAILQSDFPQHPLLRQLQDKGFSNIDGDGGQPGEARGLKSSISIDRPDSAIKVQQRQMYNSTERESEEEVGVGQWHDGDSRGTSRLEGPGDADEFLVDPFSISVWTEISGGSDNQQNQMTGRQEMRRSRMTNQERREHSRRLRERRDIAQYRQPSS